MRKAGVSVDFVTLIAQGCRWDGEVQLGCETTCVFGQGRYCEQSWWAGSLCEEEQCCVMRRLGQRSRDMGSVGDGPD